MMLLWKNKLTNLRQFGLLFFSAILLLPSFLLIIFGNSVSASSIYDDIFTPVEAAVVSEKGNPSNSIDISLIWSSLIAGTYSGDLNYTRLSSCTTGGTPISTHWANTLISEDGAWSTSIANQTFGGNMAGMSNAGDFLIVGFKEHKSTVSLEFTGPETNAQINYTGSGGSTNYAATIYLNSSDELIVTCYSSTLATFARVEPSDDFNVQPWFTTFDITYPSGYEGPEIPSSASLPKIQIYPTVMIVVQENNNVRLNGDNTWLDTYNLPNPDYMIYTLTNEAEEVIEATRLFGPYPQFDSLPNGNYRVFVNAIYTDEDILAQYEFMTTEFFISVDGTAYSVFWNPAENSYCSVRGGYEWNCEISQPGDEPSLITGEPEEWTAEECTVDGYPWIDLGACVRNGLHYFGEYLGINGPSITDSSSPFFQFDTNTFGLTSILVAPITILNNLAGAEYTCNTVELPLPYMSDDLELPCMNTYYITYLGDLYTLWQTVINGIVSYFVIVGILRMVKDAKDPQKDKIEVLAL